MRRSIYILVVVVIITMVGLWLYNQSKKAMARPRGYVDEESGLWVNQYGIAEMPEHWVPAKPIEAVNAPGEKIISIPGVQGLTTLMKQK